MKNLETFAMPVCIDFAIESIKENPDLFLDKMEATRDWEGVCDESVCMLFNIDQDGLKTQFECNVSARLWEGELHDIVVENIEFTDDIIVKGGVLC